MYLINTDIWLISTTSLLSKCLVLQYCKRRFCRQTTQFIQRKNRIHFWMLNWFRLEILNPKGLESSVVYIRQCSSVTVRPAVVTILLSKANPTFPYPMVKTVLQFFSFHVQCKYNTGINIFVYYWGYHLGQAFGRAITKVNLGYFLSSWKPTSFPGRSVGTGTREPWERGWLKNSENVQNVKSPDTSPICQPPSPVQN